MSALRRERGSALITTVLVVGIMLTVGIGLLSVVDAQTGQTRQERSGDAAFNLAEAALNARAVLLGRSWPTSSAQTPTGGAGNCGAQTMNGTLADPPASASPSLRDQVQKILADTYDGAASSQWWVTACEEGVPSSWDASLLAGKAYDPSVVAAPAPRPRRMWVRAEAHVDGRRRALVALVQAGQSPVFPSDLAVVTGKMGLNITTTGQPISGAVAGPLVDRVLGGGDPMIVGGVGVRCSTTDTVALPGCLSGVFSMPAIPIGTVAPLLRKHNFVEFRSESAVSAEQLARLRQQAQASGTYYPKNNTTGVGTPAANAACLPGGSAGKVIFIEQVGDGTGSCSVNTAGGASAKALIVGAGGVRVYGAGTFTGVIYALHRKALAGGIADVRLQSGAHVVGSILADDNRLLDNNPALAANERGFVEVSPPVIDMTRVINSFPPPSCGFIPLLGPILCLLVDLLNYVLDDLLAKLGITTTQLVDAIMPDLNPSAGSTGFPLVTLDKPAVEAVTTFGDAQTVTGTFRQVGPSY